MSRFPGRPYPRKEVLDIYAKHPLRERAILQRIRSARGSLRNIEEKDLAVDPSGATTDQNHIGGLEFVIALAQRAGVQKESRVLDLGCGLGGPARALAMLHGCRVHGVDLSPTRCREARQLTKLVGLSHLVTFECNSFAGARVDRAAYDILWNQSSWVHVRNQRSFLHRWRFALKPGGRIAMEDTYLARPPANAAEAAMLRRLEHHWKSYLNSVGDWEVLLRNEGLAITTDETCTADFLRHFALLEANGGDTHAAEKQSWRDAIGLAEAGVVCYRRLVATCARSPSKKIAR